jgi:hypothetical protein
MTHNMAAVAINHGVGAAVTGEALHLVRLQ